MSEDLVFALDRLVDESRPVRQTNLAALSDIPRSQADLFRAAWARFSPQRRLELVRELVEQAEANIHLHFYAIFRDLLFDRDAQVRKLAVEGLWEDNRASLVTLLARLLANDAVPEVRAAAALSLGRFVMLGALGEIAEDPAQQAEQALRTAWTRPREVTEVRRRALEGLAYSDASDVREMIRGAYYDEDELLRQSAVYAMGRSADARWSKYVLAELDSRDVAMRFEAATAAGELTLAPAVGQLIRLLDDPDGTVRSAAASALGQIGGPAARRALEATLSGSDENLIEAAEAALEELSFNSGAASDTMFDFAGASQVPAHVDGGRGVEDDGLDGVAVMDADEDEAEPNPATGLDDIFDEDEDLAGLYDEDNVDDDADADDDGFEYDDEEDEDWLDDEADDADEDDEDWLDEEAADEEDEVW